MPDDAELLRCYVEDRSERAFGALVQRYLNLVYSAAWRQSGGDAHLAQEIAQTVFVQLARKAGVLTRHPTLTGWLYRTTRYVAIDALRERQRRQRHEQQAAAMNEIHAGPETSIRWESLRPVLDDALAELRAGDREAVLLRFFEGRRYDEVGRALGLNENAARMRVDRALERLRATLARRGLPSSSAALATVMVEHALMAAPPGLAAGITAASVGATTSGAGAPSLFSLLTMNKPAVAALIAVLGLGTALTVLRVRSDFSADPPPALQAHDATLPAAPPGAPAPGSTPDISAHLAGRQAAVRAYHAQVAPKAVADAAAAKPVLRHVGLKTPVEAVETFAWACYTADIEAIARQIHFDGEGRALAEAVWARMPEAVQREWPTPELLYGFFTAADAITHPPPADREIFQQVQLVFLASDRMEVRFPGGGSQQYQWTEPGWKMVFPEPAIEALAAQVLQMELVPPSPTGG